MKQYKKTKDNAYLCIKSIMNMFGVGIRKGQVFHFHWNSKDGSYELIGYGGLKISHQSFVEHFVKVN